MTERGIERPSSIVLMKPGHRVMIALRSAFIGAFIDCKNHFGVWINLFKIIPLVPSLPLFGKVLYGWVRDIGFFQNGILLIRMADKVTADQPSVPSPIVFRISRAMNTHISPARLDIAFKSCFLIMIEQIACGTQEHNG